MNKRILGGLLCAAMLCAAPALAMPGMGEGKAPVDKFPMMDANKDGSVSKEEFKKFFPQMQDGAFAAIDKPHTYVSLRSFYQELYRVPTFTEAYYYHLGSQTLKPELTRQVGIGAVCRLDRPTSWLASLVVTADGWFNRVRDRIVSIPYNLYVWRTMNVGKTVARGLDLTLEARLRPAEQWQLVVAANHTLQAVEDRTLPGTIGYGCQAAYTPMHSGAASLACETPWVSLSVHTTYASERWSTNDHTPTTRLPGYAEAGATLYHRFDMGKIAIDLRADLVNAFDKQYAVVRRYPMPGRAYKLSVKVNW